jgi:hypothetical protein
VVVIKRCMRLAMLLLLVGLVAPAHAQNNDQGMATTNANDDGGFDDWGLLGLLGLAGLMGRGRKDRGTVDTRRV